MSEKTTKNISMPVGQAINRLIRLKFAARLPGNQTQERMKEIHTLTEALNAFEINLSFDCDTSVGKEGHVAEVLEKASSALEILRCDAETDCCRIVDKETSSSRGGMATSSRGD
jgi:hypothetical protein